MNRLACSVIPLFLLGLFVSTAVSQTKAITEEKFNEMIEQAKAKRSKVAYRQKESTVGYDADTSAEFITEVTPPDRSYTISVRKNAKGTTRTEVIWIGKVKYLKLNQEEWKKEEVRQVDSMSGAGSGSGLVSESSKPDIKQSYELRGTEKINGILTERYEMAKTITFNMTNGTYVRKNSRSYWYNKDGMLVKAILEDKIGSRTYRVVTEYDYDVNFKIEAPIK